MIRRVLQIAGLAGLPRWLQATIWSLAGVAAGAALVAARISNAVSYLSNAPQTCMNCHVMTDAYVSWQRGSHSRDAVCNDCHVPHDNLLAKNAFKAKDGMRHSAIFTLRREPQVLRLSAGAVPVVQQNCVRCHSDQFQMIRLSDSTQQTCWSCHQNVHGDVHGLAASPRQLAPSLPKAGLNLFGENADETER